jgi:hypothetical protein
VFLSGHQISSLVYPGVRVFVWSPDLTSGISRGPCFCLVTWSHIWYIQGSVFLSGHQISSLVYPGVRVCPVLWFVFPTGVIKLVIVMYHFMNAAREQLFLDFILFCLLQGSHSSHRKGLPIIQSWKNAPSPKTIRQDWLEIWGFPLKDFEELEDYDSSPDLFILHLPDPSSYHCRHLFRYNIIFLIELEDLVLFDYRAYLLCPGRFNDRTWCKLQSI